MACVIVIVLMCVLLFIGLFSFAVFAGCCCSLDVCIVGECPCVFLFVGLCIVVGLWCLIIVGFKCVLLLGGRV